MHKKTWAVSLTQHLRKSSRRRIIRQRVWKSLNIILAVATILNVSAFSAFLGVRAARADDNSNLSITKTVDKTTAAPGDRLTYTITVTNTGPGDAPGARVDDTLPAGDVGTPTNFNREPNAQGEGHMIYDNLFVPAHDSVVLTFTMTINSPLSDGTHTIVNKVDLSNTPIIPPSDSPFHALSLSTFTTSAVSTPTYSGSATVTTLVPVVSPSLTITKTNDAGALKNPGTTLNYTVVVTNSSSATLSAQNVILTDTLPAGFTYTVSGGATKVFALGNIAPGASVTTTYGAAISASQAAAIYTNTASAKGDNATMVSATSNVEVRVPRVLGVIPSPDLLITKKVNISAATPGQILTYTVTIENGGDVLATNVVVTDELPVGFTYAVGGGTSKTWKFATLAGHEKKVLTYQVKVGQNVKTGRYVNRAFVLADTFDPIAAQAAVTVRVPQVLGLATTGISARDYALFSLGLGLLALGFIGFSRLRRYPEVETE